MRKVASGKILTKLCEGAGPKFVRQHSAEWRLLTFLLLLSMVSLHFKSNTLMISIDTIFSRKYLIENMNMQHCKLSVCLHICLETLKYM